MILVVEQRGLMVGLNQKIYKVCWSFSQGRAVVSAVNFDTWCEDSSFKVTGNLKFPGPPWNRLHWWSSPRLHINNKHFLIAWYLCDLYFRIDPMSTPHSTSRSIQWLQLGLYLLSTQPPSRRFICTVIHLQRMISGI